jgi:two-component sensor histidine kinase
MWVGGLTALCFVMSWTEHDGPPVSQPERRGFDSTVITSIAKLTVGGEVELDYAPSGLVWRLTCLATGRAKSSIGLLANSLTN